MGRTGMQTEPDGPDWSETGRLGDYGEAAAAVFLTHHGCRVLARNWRCRHGEIDLIAMDGEELVFVEVKTRSGLGYGHPFEAITQSKRARLRKLAGTWLEETGISVASMRIDAVAVLVDRTSWDVTIEHLKAVA